MNNEDKSIVECQNNREVLTERDVIFAANNVKQDPPSKVLRKVVLKKSCRYYPYRYIGTVMF